MAKAEATIRSREELRLRYGEFFRVRTKQLVPQNVPPALRALIPYAELWGVSDDGDRDRLVDSAPKSAREDLAAVVDAYDDQFDEWLAGPESDGPTYSPEYLAFTNMRMARLYLQFLFPGGRIGTPTRSLRAVYAR